jgi:hypothetical protein
MTRSAATRNMLRAQAADNRAAAAVRPMDDELAAIAYATRARLVAAHPERSDADIDAEMKRILSAGTTPTREPMHVACQIPQDVVAARRTARREIVKRRRHLRKT